MSEQLEWTEGLHQRASRDNAHYVIHERSDGKWDVAVYRMFTDEPDATEQWLGDYRLETLADAKELAQALADQRGRDWGDARPPVVTLQCSGTAKRTDTEGGGT